MNNQRPKSCTICKIEITQNFCTECGQRLSNESTTVKSITTDFFNNLFSLDKSVFAAIWTLLSNPTKLIHNYWSGYRRYFASPGKMLVYALTIAAIHLSYVNSELLLGLSFSMGGLRDQFIFWLFFFPILTMASYLSFFREKINFAKHLISITYLATSFFIVLTVVSDIFVLFGMDFKHWPALIFVGCIVSWNSHVINRGGSVIKVVLGTVAQLIVLILIILGLAGLIYLINPESISWD